MLIRKVFVCEENCYCYKLQLAKRRGSGSCLVYVQKRNVAIWSLDVSELLELCSGSGIFCVAKAWVVSSLAHPCSADIIFQKPLWNRADAGRFLGSDLFYCPQKCRHNSPCNQEYSCFNFANQMLWKQYWSVICRSVLISLFMPMLKESHVLVYCEHCIWRGEGKRDYFCRLP